MEFVRAHRTEDVREVALHARRGSGIDMPWALDQIAGWQTARTKLPQWAACDNIVYPPHISMEQCSSEATARYKAFCAQRLVSPCGSLVDLTGGFGVDFSYMARSFAHATYVERQEHLCSIAAHNMAQLGLTHVDIVNADAEDYLARMDAVDVIFLDPARRDDHGGRTYAIADCTPDVLGMQDLLLRKARFVMVKLSPMLDWRKAVADFGSAVCDVHIVSVSNECKELLIVLSGRPENTSLKNSMGNDVRSLNGIAASETICLGDAAPNRRCVNKSCYNESIRYDGSELYDESTQYDGTESNDESTQHDGPAQYDGPAQRDGSAQPGGPERYNEWNRRNGSKSHDGLLHVHCVNITPHGHEIFDYVPRNVANGTDYGVSCDAVEEPHRKQRDNKYTNRHAEHEENACADVEHKSTGRSSAKRSSTDQREGENGEKERCIAEQRATRIGDAQSVTEHNDAEHGIAELGVSEHNAAGHGVAGHGVAGHGVAGHGVAGHRVSEHGVAEHSGGEQSNASVSNDRGLYAGGYLYEPNASIMKAGCFAEIAAYYGVEQVAANSHVFTASRYVEDFPGRVFRVESVSAMNKSGLRTALAGVSHANIAVRNFPMSVAQLRKKLKLKDGGDTYLFATTTSDGRHVIIRTSKATKATS